MNRESNLRSRPAIWVVLLFLAGALWSSTTVRGEAQPEYPADGATIDGENWPPNPPYTHIYTQLDFIPGATAAKHTGYFSDNYDDVASRVEDANLGEPPYPSMPNRYYVGLPLIPPANDTLVRGTTYYWTVDETDSDGQMFPGEVWEFTIQDFKATLPNPPNEAPDVETTVLLSWREGVRVDEHDVYIGTSWNDVYNANWSDTTGIYKGYTLEPNYLCSNLAFNTKYYWRVDEFYGFVPPLLSGDMNYVLRYSIYRGDVWCFTTVGGEAQPEFPADGAVIDGSEYIYNIYTNLDFIPGASAVEHTGYFSDNYDDVANRIEDANLGPPPYPDEPGYEYRYFVGLPAGYIPGDPYSDGLVRGTTYYWTVDETDAEGKMYPGEIWEFTIWDFKATEPDPPNEATFVETDVLLSWRPGYEMWDNDVYMGTSYEAVRDARYDFFNQPPEFLATISEPNILVIGLSFNTKYYWRIDEVLRLPPPGAPDYYIGDVWCFTTKPPLIYVDDDAVGANNGTSWENAYNYLQDALVEAESALKPIEIRVAEGVYKPDRSTSDPNGSGSRGVSFVLIDGVTIKGGYAGFGEADPNARDIEAYETILSGDLAGNDVDVNDAVELKDEPTRAENSYHVVTGSGTDANAILEGFTITGGNANGFEPDYFGGGMFNDSGSPTLINCTFSKNYAYERGGGICNIDSSPTVTNCKFTVNSVLMCGGGMYNFNSSNLTLRNCTFSKNSGGHFGGGMVNMESNLKLTNCIFSENFAWYKAGGMDNGDSNLILTNCTFTGNQSHGGDGGAMTNWEGSLTLINCILWGDIPDEVSTSIDTTMIIYSNIQGGWAGSGNIGADPCFVDTGGGDLRLSSDSPCIDAGYNNASNLPSTDLDGHTRIIDGECDGNEVVDMGAYEFNYAYMGDFDYNCEVDFADFSIIALVWLAEADDTRWDPLCNISTPADSLIDWRDLWIVCENWLAGK